jgi:hypothetical protein
MLLGESCVRWLGRSNVCWCWGAYEDKAFIPYTVCYTCARDALQNAL